MRVKRTASRPVKKYGKSHFRERNGVTEKSCTKCQPMTWYPYTEDYFGYDRSKGLRSACRWCRARDARKRRRKKKEGVSSMVDFRENFPIRALYEDEYYILRAGIPSKGWNNTAFGWRGLEIQEFKKTVDGSWQQVVLGPLRVDDLRNLRKLIDDFLDVCDANDDASEGGE